MTLRLYTLVLCTAIGLSASAPTLEQGRSGPRPLPCCRRHRPIRFPD